jgi:ankyrin repeat protein
LNQALLLGDALYYPEAIDSPPWLIYYISKPLVGFPDAISVIPTALDQKSIPKPADHKLVNGASSSAGKKQIKSFTDIMTAFPMIARQMQSGLERIFNEFKLEAEKPLPDPTLSDTASSATDVASEPRKHKRRNSTSSITSLGSSTAGETAVSETNTTSSSVYRSNLEMTPEEDELRHALENAINAAIDLFQMVDKQQLTLLGSTTDLTGALVERMIEKHVTEQVHELVLFPKICQIRKQEDIELESRMRQMVDIDTSQVGLSIDMDRAEKKRLGLRLSKGVEGFKKISSATSPQQMLELLVDTQKTITTFDTSEDGSEAAEKSKSVLTSNADTLVSLLLVVVIRSQVRHLQARISYMRHFTFIDDVESGEIGYALSTFEAVLSYLSHDSGGLRRSSLRNKRLWQATKSGNVTEMREILETEPLQAEFAVEDALRSRASSSASNKPLKGILSGRATPDYSLTTTTNGTLSHVFPFAGAQEAPADDTNLERARVKKRVSVASRSTSSSSGYSIKSLPLTVTSNLSGFDGDLSIETLVQTLGPGGDSILMMAIQNKQEKALNFLLHLEEHFPISFVLEDENNEGTTLFSAAIQSGNRTVAEMILDFIIDNAPSDQIVKDYLARKDSDGRCAAHYLFEYPALISRIGDLVPWTLKDKNGQTPLFALCRSYDHEEYKWMVETALQSAAKSQRDGQQLRVADHVDNRGNTLLHIVNSSVLANKLLQTCDSDVNSSNDKFFTPLMVASKYGRIDMVRALFRDSRVDIFAKDLRGLTAVELAKDDEARSKIEDLILLLKPPGKDGGRVTSVVRAFFVEDGSLRFLVKSAGRNKDSTITVTTCRRTFTDFENLAGLLALEHPASWIPSPGPTLNSQSTLLNSPIGPNGTGVPSVGVLTQPFLLPSKPSRAIARDMQLRLDSFLNILLSHSTFSMHEMVWEFFLVPEMNPNVLAERAKRKAELRQEMIKEDYEPINTLDGIKEVDAYVNFAAEQVRRVHTATVDVGRKAQRLKMAFIDMSDALTVLTNGLAGLRRPPASSISSTTALTVTASTSDDMSPKAIEAKVLQQGDFILPLAHRKGLRQIPTTVLRQHEFPPLAQLASQVDALSTSTSALISALSRPVELATRVQVKQRQMGRVGASLKKKKDKESKSSRPSEPILTDASSSNDVPPEVPPRSSSSGFSLKPSALFAPIISILDSPSPSKTISATEAATVKFKAVEAEAEDLGRELAYSKQIVASEMAGWQEQRVVKAAEALDAYLKEGLVLEKERGDCSVRVLREVLVSAGHEERASHLTQAKTSKKMKKKQSKV